MTRLRISLYEARHGVLTVVSTMPTSGRFPIRQEGEGGQMFAGDECNDILVAIFFREKCSRSTSFNIPMIERTGRSVLGNRSRRPGASNRLHYRGRSIPPWREHAPLEVTLDEKLPSAHTNVAPSGGCALSVGLRMQSPREFSFSSLAQLAAIVTGAELGLVTVAVAKAPMAAAEITAATSRLRITETPPIDLERCATPH
jgi:hypothetical protein